MPVCTLHLLALDPRTSLSHFLGLLAKQESKPLVTARAIRWIIRPTSIQLHPLLTYQWDLLLVFPGQNLSLPSSLRSHVHGIYTLHTGVPSSITKDFAATNAKLLRPEPSTVPPLTGTLDAPHIAPDSQSLELSQELFAWIKDWDAKGERGAVSMLNLLAFKDGMHGEYLKYGQAFAKSVGSRRGGTAKIVGRVTGGGAESAKMRWDEVALAHYPSIQHFADMLASEDYQEVNMKYRVDSLKDTCILFTSELELPSIDSQESKL